MRCSSIQWPSTLVVFGLLVLTAGIAEAQNQPPAKPRSAPQQPAARQQAPQVPQRVTANRPVEDAALRNSDQVIASMLALCNEEEVALGKLAASKTKNDKVREYADLLVKEHGQAQEQLRPFGARIEPLSENAGRHAGNGLRSQAVDEQPALATRNQAGIDFLELNREVAERCLDSAKSQWDNKNLAKADEAFIGMQIANHYHMLDLQEVLRGRASPQLQAVIEKSIQHTQAHLERAKDLIHQLANSENRTGRTTTSNRE